MMDRVKITYVNPNRKVNQLMNELKTLYKNIKEIKNRQQKLKQKAVDLLEHLNQRQKLNVKVFMPKQKCLKIKVQKVIRKFL